MMVHNGLKCTDYSELNYTYGECIETQIKQEMLSQLGCIPPWLGKGQSDKNKVCYNEIKRMDISIEQDVEY